MTSESEFNHTFLPDYSAVPYPPLGAPQPQGYSVQKASPSLFRVLLTIGVSVLVGGAIVVLLGGGAASENVGDLSASAGPVEPIILAAHGKDHCADADFTKKTLKTAYEETYFALLGDTQGEKKFEASDVVYVNNSFYVVCDNSWAIGKFERALTPFAHENYQIGQPTLPKSGDSQWEGIVYNEKTHNFYVVREAVEHEDEVMSMENVKVKSHAKDAKEAEDDENEVSEKAKDMVQHAQKMGRQFSKDYTHEMDHAKNDYSHYSKSFIPPENDQTLEKGRQLRAKKEKPHYHAVIQEIDIKGHDYEIIKECRSEFTFHNGNKGFEGAFGIYGKNGKFYLVGLCEGNFCEGGKKGRDPGHGMLIVMEKEESKKSCIWKTVKRIHLPSSVKFVDYSAVTRYGRKIAVTSQETSAVWIGELKLTEDELLDPKTIDIKGEGELYHFPRNDDCDVVYCNIEGISFISDNLLVAVSDKMKSGGRQDFRCLAKDQSVHVFAIP